MPCRERCADGPPTPYGSVWKFKAIETSSAETLDRRQQPSAYVGESRCRRRDTRGMNGSKISHLPGGADLRVDHTSSQTGAVRPSGSPRVKPTLAPLPVHIEIRVDRGGAR